MNNPFDNEELNSPGTFGSVCDGFVIYRSTEAVTADELLAVAKAEMAMDYPYEELQHLRFGVADVEWGAPPVVVVYTGGTNFDPYG